MLIESIINRIDHYRDDMIEMQRQLCALPALAPENQGDGEKEKADLVMGWLERLPCSRLELIKAPDDRVSCGYRPNLIAVLEGENPSRTLWLMSHLDVVPPGDLSNWSGDPWSLRVEGDKLIGRGCEDNHQGVVSSLFAAKAFADLNITPKINLGLMLVADEETGSRYGVQYLLTHHREFFRETDLFLIPDAGNPQGSMIEVAEKSILWLKFVIKGVQTHGSTPHEGRNAHRAGAELIVRLNHLYKEFDARDPLFDPPESTFEPTKKEANVPNINTIPGEDIFYFDCRILPCYPIARVREAVQKHCDEVSRTFGVRIAISTPQEEPAAPPTPPDAEIVQAIQKAVSELRHLDCHPVGIGGGTVAAFFRRAGYPAAVWCTIADVAHEPDEFCLLTNLVEDAKVFAHIALQDR